MKIYSFDMIKRILRALNLSRKQEYIQRKIIFKDFLRFFFYINLITIIV